MHYSSIAVVICLFKVRSVPLWLLFNKFIVHHLSAFFVFCALLLVVRFVWKCVIGGAKLCRVSIESNNWIDMCNRWRRSTQWDMHFSGHCCVGAFTFEFNVCIAISFLRVDKRLDPTIDNMPFESLRYFLNFTGLNFLFILWIDCSMFLFWVIELWLANNIVSTSRY